MKKTKRQHIISFCSLIVIAILNQNCGKGFSTIQSASLGSTLSASCPLPWGGTVESGDSITAYLSATVPNGQVCSSQIRTCDNGALSGTYQNQACTVLPAPGGASCTLPWGGTISSGQFVTAYQSTTVPYGQTCASETRVCDNGALSGSYQKQSCSVLAPVSCPLPWGGTINSGKTVTAYQSSTVPYGQSCASETRACTNGALSGSYQNQSCSVSAPTYCSLPWGGTINNGQSVTAYQSATVPNGQTCTPQTRTCSNGALSGSYDNQSCSVLPPVGNGSIQSAHPRMILDDTVLARLRANAANNTPGWVQLKSFCDKYVGGTTNLPNQNAYPNAPTVGQGYQGDGYADVVLSEALCYQILKTSNPTLANSYADKAVQVLVAMSTPYPGNGQNPATDAGYGIRNYGEGFGLGYDWVYEKLDSSQKTQVYTTANKWVKSFEDTSFEYGHPQSNYFAGYFAAKSAIAIGTYGDNPDASTMWDDFINNQFAKRVQPYYQKHLTGGGWPEGFGNYGPGALLHMNLPVLEVKTATGIDMVQGSTPFSFPLDNADYLMHFTWPSRDYIDDRDTNHANGNASTPVGTASVSTYTSVLGMLREWNSPKANYFAQYIKDVSTATGGFGVNDRSWVRALFEDVGTASSYSSLPASYLASGLGAVSARSDWTTSASWMSLRAGPYINSPDQGEEGFDQGSIALVRGKTPLLVNATGWLSHEPNGSDDESKWYDDLYGSFSSSNVYRGNRQIYNVFYVRNMSGSNLAEQFGQAAFTSEDYGVKTKISSFEDGTSYVYTLATNLEDMYRRFNSGVAVSSWSRQIVYLRPNRFIVYDRTTKGSASYDQYLAFHFPANPSAGTAPAGETRLDVTYNSTYAGAMTVVLPSNSTTTTTAMYPTSSVKKVWQVQVRPPDSAVTQKWLTVFDLSTSSNAVATATNITVTQGNAVGVLLSASDGNSAVISNAGNAGTTISGTIVYTVPNATTQHVITELPANTNYSVSVSVSGGNKVITVSPGSGYKTSAKGVLSFTQ